MMQEFKIIHDEEEEEEHPRITLDHEDELDFDEEDDIKEERLHNKTVWRVMPLVYILFFFAFLDRANLGNMHNAIMEDIPMSESKFGFALGVFYISYVAFQVPSNYILEILKPKKWISIIAFSWGTVTLLSVFISSSATLIVFRFLLGVAESGLAPALMLYMRLWFSDKYRARVIAIFTMAIPVSNFVSGLISGFVIPYTDGKMGLSEWQWLYIVEGIPTLLVGCSVLLFLPNSPQEAKFLNEEDKILINKFQKMDYEHQRHIHLLSKRERRKEIMDTLTAARNWMLAIIGFFLMIPSAGISGYLPHMLSEFGLSNQNSNLLSSLPNLVAIISLYYWSRRSDKKRERFYHTASALAVAILGLALSCIFLSVKNLWLFLMSIVIYLMGFWAGSSIFLTHGVTSVVGSPAIGIALYNTIYTSGGWVGPYIMGILRDHTANHIGGILLCGGSILIGIILLSLFKFYYEKPKPIAFVEMHDMSVEDEDVEITIE